MMVGIWTTEGQQMISIYFTRVHFYFLKESERSSLCNVPNEITVNEMDHWVQKSLIFLLQAVGK